MVKGRPPDEGSSGGRQLLLHDAGIEGGGIGQELVVEVVGRIVDLGGIAVADVDIGAGHLLQHEGEVLRAHDERAVAVDIRLAGELGGDVGLVDVFKWELGDEGNKGAPASDVIKDWDNASANVSTGVGGDVLDLRDLLIGEHSATNLDDFLHFELSGANTIVHVSATGEFASGYNPAKEVQTITLENTDLFAAGTLNTDQQIINDLLTKGKLITD